MANPPKPDFRIFLRAASLLNSSLDLDVVLRELLDGVPVTTEMQGPRVIQVGRSA